MKTRVVLIDDDYSALQAIKNYCDQLDLSVIEVFESSKKFVDSFETLNFDVAILDYAMPQINGLQVAELLNSKSIPVIFVTGHRDEIASKAWDLNCIDCIEKPVTIDKIKKAIRKFSSLTNTADAYISVDIYGSQVAKIKLSDIAYITSCSEDTSKNDKTLCIKSGRKYRVVIKKFEDLLNLLPNDKFMKIGKSNVVAKDSIDSYTKNLEELTLNIGDKDRVTLPISPAAIEDFKSWFLEK